MSFNAREIFCVERVYYDTDREVYKEKPNALSNDGIGLRFGKLRLVIVGFKVWENEHGWCCFAAAEFFLFVMRKWLLLVVLLWSEVDGLYLR